MRAIDNQSQRVFQASMASSRVEKCWCGSMAHASLHHAHQQAMSAPAWLSAWPSLTFPAAPQNGHGLSAGIGPREVGRSGSSTDTCAILGADPWRAQ